MKNRNSKTEAHKRLGRETSEPFACWGASTAGSAYLENSDRMPKFFVDSDPSKWGTRLGQFLVLPPHFLTPSEVLAVVVTSDWEEEIRKSAIALGYRDEDIIVPPKALVQRQIFRTDWDREAIANAIADIHDELSFCDEVVAIGGTALGFYREKDFIQWDVDCDFRLPYGRLEDLRDFLSTQLERRTAVRVSELWGKKNHITAVYLVQDKFVPVDYDFFDSGMTSIRERFLDYSWKFSTSMFSEPDSVCIWGRKFWIPSHTVDYLTDVFGESFMERNSSFSDQDYGHQSG